MKLAGFFFSIFLTINSCGTSKQNSFMPENQSEQLSGSYIVTMLGDKDILNHKLTISFDKEKNHVSGYSGCNRFSGSFVLKEKKITFGPLASTRKMCLDDANRIEHDFLTALNEVTSFALDNNGLTLLKDNNPLLVAKNDNSYVIEYTAHSRGLFQQIIVTNEMISFQKDRQSKPKTESCNKTDWNKLMALLKDVNVTSLSKLEAPTKAHQYDGAAITTLKISHQGNSYETPSFDQGNPPEEIKVLVKEILSIAQNIE